MTASTGSIFSFVRCSEITCHRLFNRKKSDHAIASSITTQSIASIGETHKIYAHREKLKRVSQTLGSNKN